MKKNRSRKKRSRTICIVGLFFGALVCLCILLTAALYFASYGDGFDNSAYAADAFKGERVLVLAPHEDDDVAMAGATIRLYIDGGAEVYVAFASNGDFGTDAAVRVREAVRGLRILGVPEENIVFLGYGDSWDFSTYLHLYHAPGDALVPSAAGRTETFGAAGYPDFHSTVYHEPAGYTRSNFVLDIRNLLVMLRPDTVFCVDLDSHTDHCGLSWLFEEAMCEVLRTHADYRPTVYKGYAYSVAWFGKEDFYADNLLSAQMPSPDVVNDARFPLDQPGYLWDERVRFLAPREALSYTLRANIVFRALAAHRSQEARFRAENIINADTVFFERRTDSALYADGVQLSASSGDPSGLNDFKLVDTDNILDAPMAFNHGVWRPDASDPVKSVTVTLPSPATLACVALYDYYEPDSNILSGTLTFSDGSVVEVGALQPTGQETVVTFPQKRGVTSFTFKITSSEGDAPGLSELAAYAPDAPRSPAFIKLALSDESQSFLYRYTAKAGEVQPLSVYTCPSSNATYSISVVSGNGDVTVTDGVLRVAEDARPGTSLVTARLIDDPAVFDTIEIVVPGFAARPWRQLLALYEKLLDRAEYRLLQLFKEA